MTIQEFRAQYPEEVAQVEAEARASVDHTEAVNSAVQEERDRLAAIDEVAGLFPADMVREAKYGEHPCSAAELALKAAQAAAKAGSTFLSNLTDDAKASGAGDVPPAPVPDVEPPATNASREAEGFAMAQKINEAK